MREGTNGDEIDTTLGIIAEVVDGNTSAGLGLEAMIDEFNSLTGANPGDALEKAFRFAISNAKNKLDNSAGSKLLTLLDNTPLMIAWIVFLAIFIIIIRKYVKERKAGCEQLLSDKKSE